MTTLDSDHTTVDVPSGPVSTPVRRAADIVDLLVVLAPLLLGWLVVRSLRDDNGGGDRKSVV